MKRTTMAIAAALVTTLAALPQWASAEQRPPPSGFPGKPNVIEVPLPQDPPPVIAPSAHGSARATGGNAAAKAEGGSAYNALGITDNSNFITFGAPAWTMVPPATDCTFTKSTSGSIVIISGSSTDQYTGPVCAMLALADKADASCQYGTANLLKSEAMKLLKPDMGAALLAAMFPERANLTPTACADLLLQRLLFDARRLSQASR